MIYRIIIFFLMFVNNSWGQVTSEKLLFSFTTEHGKTLSLKLDTVNNVMIYRYGSLKKIELEVSDDLNDSITVFTYSYYFRGGGVNNAGLDLNYISFVNNGYKYTIYTEYSAEDGDTAIGVTVIEMEKGEANEISGIYKTIQGSLVSPFRWDELIPTVEME